MKNSKFKLSNLGPMADQHFENKNYKEAISLYIKILTNNPSNFVAKSNLGLCHFQIGEFDKALRIFEKLYKTNSSDPALLNRLGVTLNQLGDPINAEAYLLKASELDPKRFETWVNLCNVAGSLRKFDVGVHYAFQALQIDPQSPEAYINFGASLLSVAKYQAALIAFQTALELAPHNQVAAINIGSTYSYLNRIEEAIDAFEKAIAINPNHPFSDKIRFFLSMEFLKIGQIEKGFSLYEYGFSKLGYATRNPPRIFSSQKWYGKPMADADKLLIWREQGLGDELLFFSCLPDVFTKVPANQVIVECDPRLVNLLSRSFPECSVRSASFKPAPDFSSIFNDFSYQLPCGSLPHIFRKDIGSFDRSGPYLIPDNHLVEKYKRRLGDDFTNLRIGICWRSGVLDANRNLHYAPLADWINILSTKGVTFVNLQYGQCTNELLDISEHYGVHINNWPDIDLKNHLDDVAGIIGGLDLVISAGTAVAEMAAAIGIETWVYFTKANWGMLGQDEYPWYKNCKAFISTNQDHSDSISAISEALKSKLILKS
jgi:tetratricopeptide (TPR) repeat protein